MRERFKSEKCLHSLTSILMASGVGGGDMPDECLNQIECRHKPLEMNFTGLDRRAGF